MRKFDILQIHDDRPLTEWEVKCIVHLQGVAQQGGHSYTFLDLPHYETIVETVNASDALRFEWLAAHPDGLYIDTDCLVKSLWTPPEDGMCYFPRNEALGHPDVFMIYVNGNTDYIKDNFDISIRKEYIEKNVEPDLRKDYYGWPVRIMEGLKGFGWIPEDIYQHRALSMQYEVMRRKSIKLHERSGKMARDINQVVGAINEALIRVQTDLFEIRDAFIQQANRIGELEAQIGKMQDQAEDIVEGDATETLKQNVLALNKKK